VEIRRRQLPLEGRPPAPHRERPEQDLADRVERRRRKGAQLRDQPTKDPEPANDDLPRDRRRALVWLRPPRPAPGRVVAPRQDLAVPFLDWLPVAGRRGDL